MYVGRRINSIIDLMSQHATLLTSDINLTRDVACDMLDHFGIRRKKSISVVQVPHHGSRDYWSPENASYICPVCHRVPVDNNRCEQMMRPVAQGRRSWLFAGSLRGGERLAELLTLLHTARLNGLEPVVWLRDVLEKLPSWPASRLDELLPYRHPAD